MKSLRFLPALLLTTSLAFAQATPPAHAVATKPSPYQLAVKGPVSQRIAQEVAAGQAYLIDVRTPAEYQTKHLQNSQNIDFRAADFQQQVQLLDKTKAVYLYCRSGHRSGQAADLLHTLGYARSFSVGALDSLSVAGLPVAK